jgi:sulfatase modifying factor 1
MWKYLALVLLAPLPLGCARAEAADERLRGDNGAAKNDAGSDAGMQVAQIGEVAHTSVASVINAPSGDAAKSECPEGMILVEGEYCPDVEQHCLKWMDPPGDRYAHFRCAKYAKPATCNGKRVHKRFCIDAIERTEPGSDIPRNKQSWAKSKTACEADGARLCMTSEWQFACEGEEMRPYPYGWERDAKACNVDVMSGLGHVGRLVDHRTPASAHPRCVSPFGVHDMAGNVDEWATMDGMPPGKREVMKGSWWLPGRHACRSYQGGHGPWYGGTESGTRCCKDAPPEPSAIAAHAPENAGK